MPQAIDYNATFRQSRGTTILARVVGPDGNNIVQATVSAISLVVQRHRDPGTPTHNAAVPVATTVFNTLQTNANDARWVKDDIGYNFAYEIPGTAFPNAGEHYVIEFKFTPLIGSLFSVIAKGGCKSSHN